MAHALPLLPTTTIHCEGDEDEHLVAQAQANPEVFAVLYRRYAVDVYRYCYRRLGEREAAEDATSTIFTRALGGLAGLRGQPFRPWLFTIAHNVVVDHARLRRPTVPWEHVAEPKDSAPSPESLTLAAEERRALATLLSQLPARERQVIELRLAGLTGAEIAQVLGCGHGAVRVAHHRAISRLRRLIESSEVERHA